VLQNIITFDKVYYSYPRTKKWALKGIDFSVKTGEFLAVMGENGAGKTSFCKLINGIIPNIYGGKLSGTVTVDGISTANSTVSHLAQKAGMVLDDPDAQIFTSSVREETAFGPGNLLLPACEIEERAKWALSAAGLSGYEQRQPVTLSGGEKQRLAIAATLAMRTKIIVLDEPFCRLDHTGAQEVIAALLYIRRKYEITVIMASHDSGKMAEIADRVLILKDGQIIACDTAKVIFSNHNFLAENGIQPPNGSDVNKIFTVKNENLQVNEKGPAVKINNFRYSYKVSNISIENINLSFADNDFAAIAGSNGSGKTTLLKNITGLLKPCAGDIYIRGINTKALSISDISKEAGFVMQNPDNQLFTASVYKEVSFSLKNAGLSRQEVRRRTEDALRTVGLEDFNAFPHALCKADRTKTIIACILAMGCKIIIFDEIDVGQDYNGSLKVMNIARELHSKGYTIIFVTHNMSLICAFAQRLIMMDKKGIITDMRREKNGT
jgi:energy-coupling factor transport system ATP-binding protein